MSGEAGAADGGPVLSEAPARAVGRGDGVRAGGEPLLAALVSANVRLPRSAKIKVPSTWRLGGVVTGCFRVAWWVVYCGVLAMAVGRWARCVTAD